MLRLPPPEPAVAERLITIEAVASVRVVPTRLRLVFAISALGVDASAASLAARGVVGAAKDKLQTVGVKAADIDVDFIAAVPVYSWGVAKQSSKDVLEEKRSGTRVQYNLHVQVADEAAALTAIEAATAGVGADLLAVDYWSDDLEARQIEAEAKALAAAQAKAKRMLVVFASPPLPVNVHENTRVLFPQQLYHNLTRAEDSAEQWYSRDLPRVPASRPLLIYYRGLFADLDTGDPVMPGARHIEIVSTVRLYYEAPGRPPLVDTERE